MTDSSSPGEEQFESEGLVEGLEGKDRQARLDLLRQLADSGVELEELKRAAAEDRLATLPIERLFREDARYTLAEWSERSGLSEDFLRRDLLALGLPRAEDNAREYSEQDIEAAKMLRQVLDSGLSEERFLDMVRIVGRASAVSAEVILQTFAEAFLKAGDTERDLGLRYAGLAEGLMPMMAPLLGNAVKLHMRELVTSEVIGRSERISGQLPGTRDITVAFADMVGFTRLGETTTTEGVGDLAQRFELMAGEAAQPPVRLIKLIGDAAMLVSLESDPLVEATLQLLDAAREAQDFPELRAGAAQGPAFRHGGDWYGRTVNMASRITGVAPEGALLVTAEVRRALGERFATDPHGPVSLKGIDQPVEVFRLSGLNSEQRAIGG